MYRVPCTMYRILMYYSCTYIFLWPFEHFSFAFIGERLPFSSASISLSLPLSLSLSLCRFLCFVWLCLLPQRFKNSCTKCKQKRKIFWPAAAACVMWTNFPDAQAAAANPTPLSFPPRHSLSLALCVHIYLLHLAAIFQYNLVYTFA